MWSIHPQNSQLYFLHFPLRLLCSPALWALVFQLSSFLMLYHFATTGLVILNIPWNPNCVIFQGKPSKWDQVFFLLYTVLALMQEIWYLFTYHQNVSTRKSGFRLFCSLLYCQHFKQSLDSRRQLIHFWSNICWVWLCDYWLSSSGLGVLWWQCMLFPLLVYLLLWYSV